jgi:hypothetical protein
MAMKSIKKLYGSPAIVSVSRGAGEFAGAGELPPRGPGVAAKRKISAVVPAPKSGGRRGGRSK